jgi:outer membrane receptor protein involved in Fe transport
MKLRQIFTLVVSLLLFVLFISSAIAQTSKGILVGVVRDQTQAAVPDATVTVTAQDTGETRTVKTQSNGTYRIEAINPGKYTLHVQVAGFNNFDLKDLLVQPSVVTSYDPQLVVGEVNQTLEVQANSNAINTENGQLAGTVQSIEIAKTPIFTLNPVELVSTLAGVQVINSVQANSSPSPGIYGNGVSIEVNGARPRSNNFMLDGQDINDVGIGGQAFQPIIPDVYQSVTALVNNAPAEYGRSGGAVVNLITKSGTNTIHGSVFDRYTGSGLNALDGITRQQKGPGLPAPQKARFDTHDIGFTLGVPILRNKLFAFGAGDWHRYYGNQQPGGVELPDQAGYNLISSVGGSQAKQLQLYLDNGTYLTQYTEINPTSPAVSSLAVTDPTGSGPCATGCKVTTHLYQRPPLPLSNPDSQWMYRIDFTPRQQDTLTFRYLHDRTFYGPYLALNISGLPGFDAEDSGPSELAMGSWTHVLSPTLVNEFRVGETRISFAFTGTPETLANPAAKLPTIVLAGSGFANANSALGVSQNIPQGRKQSLYQFQDTVSWTHGRHTIRAGADIGREIDTDTIAQNALGTLSFNAGGGGSALDNYLNNRLGTSGAATKSFGPTRIDPHNWMTGYFLQDDWKVSPDLTFNLGMRYDYISPPENSLPFPAIDASNIFGPIDAVVKVKSDKNNFAPRFGFAFNPHSGIFSDGKTVFHGGVGIFYDTDFSNIAVNSGQTSPNAPSGTLQSTAVGGLTNASSLLNTIAPTLTPRSTVSVAVLNNLVNPLTYQWNVGFERELPAQLKLAINYVGARGEKLYTNQQFNYFVNGTRVNPARGVVNARTNGADSVYNSVQTEVSHNFSHGIFVRGTYTFGKDLDNGSEVFTTISSPTSYQANLNPNGGHRQDWGPSVWDRRHFFSVTYVWSPGGFHSSNKGTDIFLSAFTRHFVISGITQLQSGTYSSFNLNGLDTNGDSSSANDRPLIGNPGMALDTAGIDGSYLGSGFTRGTYYDAVTGLPVTASQVHWLVPNGSQYLPFEIGRNSYQNPGYASWNVAAEKNIPTTWLHFERGSLIIRAEAQDIGNHNNVGVLNTNILNIGSSAYLNKQQARFNDGRQLNLWVKLAF